MGECGLRLSDHYIAANHPHSFRYKIEQKGTKTTGKTTGKKTTEAATKEAKSKSATQAPPMKSEAGQG